MVDLVGDENGRTESNVAKKVDDSQYEVSERGTPKPMPLGTSFKLPLGLL